MTYCLRSSISGIVKFLHNVIEDQGTVIMLTIAALCLLLSLLASILVIAALMLSSRISQEEESIEIRAETRSEGRRDSVSRNAR